MNHLDRTCARATLIALVLAAAISIAVSSPTRKDAFKWEKVDKKLEDPLIALPSGSEDQYTLAENRPTVVPAYQIVHQVQYKSNEADSPYRHQYETAVVHHQQPSVYYQDISSRRQQVVQPNGANYPQNQEYTPVNAQPDYTSGDQVEVKDREYPGEIIYVDANGQQVRPESQSSNQNELGGPLSNVVNMIYENSNLPATILTEVPVRDMPLEVLEKLRKDYGVKIVATRERPGANLIINCDDNGQETGICSKQAQMFSNNDNHQRSYSYPDRVSDSPAAGNNYQGGPQAAVSDERPQIPSEDDNRGKYGGRSPNEPQPDTYAVRDYQVRASEEGSTQENERGGSASGYGSRNAASSSNESLDPEAQVSQHEGSNQASVQPERTEGRPEGESNGFEESSNGERGTKNAQQYDNRQENSP